MTDKFMFDSEEQARNILHIAHNTRPDQVNYDVCIINFHTAKLIRKSELQTLVEEAEREYNNFQPQLGMSYAGRLIIILQETIQALKKDHPELKK